MPEAETLIILQNQGLSKIVLVGDNKQLPSVVLSSASREVGFDVSLFDRLALSQSPNLNMNMLRTQYRMRPELSLFPNRTWYVLGFLTSIQGTKAVLSMSFLSWIGLDRGSRRSLASRP